MYLCTYVIIHTNYTLRTCLIAFYLILSHSVQIKAVQLRFNKGQRVLNREALPRPARFVLCPNSYTNREPFHVACIRMNRLIITLTFLVNHTPPPPNHVLAKLNKQGTRCTFPAHLSAIDIYFS